MNNNKEIKPSASCAETNTQDRYEVEYVDFLYRQHELKKHEEKLSRAKEDIQAAKAVLCSNSDALWAALYLLHIHENEQGLASIGGCVNPEHAVPRAVLDAFVRSGSKDEAELRLVFERNEEFFFD